MNVIAWPAFRTRKGNPYNWLLYRALQAQGVKVTEYSIRALFRKRYDVWHVHWPECYLNCPSFLEAAAKTAAVIGLLEIAKRRGIAIVWTIHNLRAHEGAHPRLERWFWRNLTKRVDACVSPSKTGLRIAQRLHPSLRTLPTAIVPIGTYETEYLDEITRAQARRVLGIRPSDGVVLYFGHIRPYKGVVELIRTFRLVPHDDLRLLIVGEPKTNELREAIRGEAFGDDRITLVLRQVSNESVQVYFRAADLVVLPFREILNSSSAVLALTFACPVLVPGIGAVGELADAAGPEWVRQFGRVLTPTALKEGLAWARHPRNGAPRFAPGWD